MDTLRGLWKTAELPAEALASAWLTGADPVLPSSFAVGDAARSSIAAAALAACELGHLRGQPRQMVDVDMAHAAMECSGWFALDGKTPPLWDDFSGLYACADGWVRVHANFRHHRDGALRLLELDPQTATRADAEAAMRGWEALAYEEASARAGLVACALRSFEQWDLSPQGQAVAELPLFDIQPLGGAPVRQLPRLSAQQQPLAGLRVLDLTRILAGPVAGRALAAHGADVMLVNAPHLPNIDSIADTSRGKLSVLLDLRREEDLRQMARLLDDTHVFIQGYRPGALANLGLAPHHLAAMRPGIVVVSLCAWGHQGPWAMRRGFDSLVQTAMGFNRAEAQAAGVPHARPLPMQILDQASGYLMALGACAALCRQQREGGSWHVRVSLAQTGHWLRSLGRVENGFGIQRPDPAPWLETVDSGFGRLTTFRHSARLARTPAGWRRPSMPPGSHAPEWPSPPSTPAT